MSLISGVWGSVHWEVVETQQCLEQAGGVGVCTPGCPSHCERRQGQLHGGHGGLCGTAAAIAGMAPARGPCRL